MAKRRVFIGDFKFGPDEKKVLQDIIRSNKISEGKYVEAFSKNFAKFIGTKYCIPVNSGTSALMLVMAALRYHSKYAPGKNNKVITTPLTYVATPNSLITTGYEPVFVDINLDDFSLNVEQVAEKLEQNEYYGMMPVHLMGYPCDMKTLNKLAQKNKLPVIEDACEAHGSDYRGKKTGSIGLAGCFSFFIAHNIQAGEFGCITTDNKELAELTRSMKGNGRKCACLLSEIKAGKCTHKNTGFHPRYIHEYIGYNFKAMEYQAAVGVTQLKKANWINQQRTKNVKYLNDALSDYQDILQLPEHSKKISYLGYPLLVIDKKHSRNKIAVELEKQGVETRPIFNCIPTQQPAYSFLKKQYQGKLPNAEFVGNNGFYVGCHQYLTERDLNQTVRAIKNALK